MMRSLNGKAVKLYLCINKSFKQVAREELRREPEEVVQGISSSRMEGLFCKVDRSLK